MARKLMTDEEKDARIEELEKQVESLEKKIEQLEKELSKTRAGLSGYIVKTPNPYYAGITSGVFFRNGKAFIPDGKRSEEIVGILVKDFGYTAVHVDDYKEGLEQ